MINGIKKKEKDNLLALSYIILKNLSLFDVHSENNLKTFETLLSSPSVRVLNINKRSVMQLMILFALIDFKKTNDSSLDYVLKKIRTIDTSNSVMIAFLMLLKEKNYSELAYLIAHHIWGMDKSKLKSNWKDAIFLLVRPDYENTRLAQRFRKLTQLPSNTLGSLLCSHFEKLQFPFPGEEGAYNYQAIVPHDSLHVLTGYAVNVKDEILLTGFTMGMGATDIKTFLGAMSIILVAHNSIPLFIEHRMELDTFPLEQWLLAYIQGLQCTINVYSDQWNFWQASTVPINTLRKHYHITPITADSQTYA